MPDMSVIESTFCRCAPWRVVARRVVPWATQGVSLAGDVLEIGGGGGVMAPALVRAQPSIRLTTTDYDPAMVADARTRLARYPHIPTRQADATHLPFSDEAFDYVASFLMLHHVIDWEESIGEAFRVLRPGGTFLGYDLTVSRAASWLHFADRSPHRLIERRALEPALEMIGFEPVRVRYSLGGRVLRFAASKSETNA